MTGSSEYLTRKSPQTASSGNLTDFGGFVSSIAETPSNPIVPNSSGTSK